MFILQLNPDQSGNWIEVNAEDVVTAMQTVSSFEDCPKATPDLALLIPGENITATTVALPKARPAERTRIAAFSLEDELATDPESLYVVIGKQAAETQETYVTFLDRAYFEQLHAAWTAANVTPAFALPDFLAIRWEPETWSLLLDRGMAIVRTGLQLGFTVDASNLSFFLQHYFEKNPEKTPGKIRIWQTDTVSNLPDFAKHDITVEQCDSQSQSPWDVQGLPMQLNLLQGAYRAKSKQSALQKSWWACGIAAASWLVFLFIGQGVQAFYLNYQAKKIHQQVKQVYMQLFPGASSVLEPHFRTKKLLKSYAAASTGGAFLKLYRVAAGTLLQYPSLSAQQISFAHSKMILEMDAKTEADLTTWISAVKAKGISVDEKVKTTDTNEVTATVTLSKA